MSFASSTVNGFPFVGLPDCSVLAFCMVRLGDACVTDVSEPIEVAGLYPSWEMDDRHLKISRF